jgi:hypothetical protein
MISGGFSAPKRELTIGRLTDKFLTSHQNPENALS